MVPSKSGREAFRAFIHSSKIFRKLPWSSFRFPFPLRKTFDARPMELKIKMLRLFTEDILGGSAIAHPGSSMASRTFFPQAYPAMVSPSLHFESMPGHMEIWPVESCCSVAGPAGISGSFRSVARAPRYRANPRGFADKWNRVFYRGVKTPLGVPRDLDNHRPRQPHRGLGRRLSSPNAMKALTQPGLLIIEVGYLRLDQAGAAILFQIHRQSLREKRRNHHYFQ